MARYHFNVRNGNEHPDPDGSEFVSIAQARTGAVSFFGGILCDRPERFWEVEEMQVEVTDEAGLILFTLNMSATVSPALRSG